MEATNVLERTVQMEQTKKIICHEGGSRSSKTFSIFQFFILKALAGEGIVITIARDKLTWVKQTLLKDFEEITRMYNIEVSPAININRPEQTYYINGSEFSFFGLDYAQKLHGRKQDWFWLNEAMEIAKTHFDQLEMRTNIGAVIDYNPIDDTHWVFDLQKRDDVGVIKSTMLDNPFLPSTIIKKIRSYEPTAENITKGTADSYMWEVYGLGNKAKLKGVIYEYWDIVETVPENAKFIGYGLDFGFSSDPAAFLAVYKMDNELYVNEIFYEVGLVNAAPDPHKDSIVKRFESLAISKVASMVGDSSEPKSIVEIGNYGYDIEAVEKGPDSITFGIDLVKGYRLHITKRSVNIEKELRRYKWKEDKNGKALRDPIDDFNHALDALRYVVMTFLRKDEGIQLYNANRLGL